MGWDVNAQLLAGVVDQLAVANWQRQGKKSAKRPEPVPRPGQQKSGRTFGTTSMSMEEADAWLADSGLEYMETSNDLLT